MNPNIAFNIQIGFLLHLLGDYILQTTWMANEKTKRFLPAFIHALTYSLPFLFITSGWWWVILFVTHYFIDRYRLAVYIIKIRENNWNSTNYGFSDAIPQFLSMWLLFITDNSIHLFINTFCIYMSN